MAESRKGATKLANISPDILQQLNTGQLATANLMEGLAIDFQQLWQHCFAELPASALASYDPAAGVVKRMQMMGQILNQSLGFGAFNRVATHHADTVRGWAAFMLADQANLSVAERLNLVQPLADDAHFGVREWAWLALRPQLTADLATSLNVLQTWVADSSENIRRFAIEALRPRGVWCSHINQLKQNPALALELLTPVRSDTSRYVQLSVANWLNDASKTQPSWVEQLTEQWLVESPSAETRWIVNHATRSLRKTKA
ncbi:DNA alkylation repair protein [Herpetosiphon gulosus]|uniref:DNA alkylation repair protein n=1 Tax=Herpetosiphon gulosus TaxID=1973496 RepID=A0ABP9WZG8_9CHLR